MAPRWLSLDLILAVHVRQLAEHGGPAGVRDQGLLESALARPEQTFAYGDAAIDLPALAAAYAYGIARNHPFSDGNKRTAIVACELFLNLNGWELAADDIDLYPAVMGLAAGEIDEAGFAAWLRERVHLVEVNERAPRYRARP